MVKGKVKDNMMEKEMELKKCIMSVYFTVEILTRVVFFPFKLVILIIDMIKADLDGLVDTLIVYMD